MALPMIAETAPLDTADDDAVRVGGTRVTLDTVVGAFREGASAEEIVWRYPSLDLVDVYATITYYLRHRDEVQAYLSQREARGRELRQRNQMRFPPTEIRERLLARHRPE